MRNDVVRFELLDSTNKYLLANPSEGLVVVADQQTAGYGRKGDEWSSPAGNIYMSYGFFEERELSSFSLAVGVALAELLASFGIGAKLKWPNDVLVAGKKIAGILIETIEIEARKFVVVGIGLNVNADVPHRASMKEALGREADKDEVIDRLCERLKGIRREFFEDKNFLKSWDTLSNLVIGEEIRFDTATQIITGKYLGITNTGAIIIDERAYVSGSIVQK